MKQATYKPLGSRVFTARVTAAAREQLSPAERERIDAVCARLSESMRHCGPSFAREIVAAIGRLMVERGR